jgi:hypothetical protein
MSALQRLYTFINTHLTLCAHLFSARPQPTSIHIGLKEEGLFRISGSVSSIQKLRTAVEKGLFFYVSKHHTHQKEVLVTHNPCPKPSLYTNHHAVSHIDW